MGRDRSIDDVRLLDDLVKARFGSRSRGRAAMGISWLDKYLGGQRRMPLSVFLEVTKKLGLPLQFFSPSESISLSSFLIYLKPEDISTIEDPLFQEGAKLVRRIVKKTGGDREFVVVETDADEIVRQFERLTFEARFVSVEINEEWRGIKKDLRSRRPGGFTPSGEAVGRLGRFFLIQAGLFLTKGDGRWASRYLRLFFQLPWPTNGTTPLLGVTTLMSLLRFEGDLKQARLIGETLFSQVVGHNGHSGLVALFSLTYSVVLSDLGESSKAVLRLCLRSAPNTVWGIKGVLNLSQQMIAEGKPLKGLEILESMNVPEPLRGTEGLRILMCGDAYAAAGMMFEARSCYHRALSNYGSDLWPFRVIISLIDLLKSGELPAVVYHQLRRLGGHLNCSEKAASARLRRVISTLERQLLREDGPDPLEIEAVRKMSL